MVVRYRNLINIIINIFVITLKISFRLIIHLHFLITRILYIRFLPACFITLNYYETFIKIK